MLEDVPTAARVGRTKLDTERRGTINTINLWTLFSSKLENQWEALNRFSILKCFYTIPAIVGDGSSVFEESFGQAECVDCSVQGMQTVAP